MGAAQYLRIGRTFLTDRRSAYYYLQRTVRTPRLRQVFASTIARFQPRGTSDGVEVLASTLERRGYGPLPEDFVTPAEVVEIRSFLDGEPCADGNRRFSLDRRPPECRKVSYGLDSLLRCPHLLERANHPLVLRTAAALLGCKPTITTINAWWSFVGGERQSEVYQDDMYHRDVADFAFLRLFIYLSHVDEESGPHMFVRGSHRSPHLVRRGPISDEEVARYFSPQDVMTVTGGAGTAFLEDTWGVHRATPLKSRPRLIFSVNYSITSLNVQAPPAPVELDLRGRGPFDPYVNRVCLKPL